MKYYNICLSLNRIIKKYNRKYVLYILILLLGNFFTPSILIGQSANKQLEEINQIFSDISNNEKYVEDLNFNEDEAICLPVGLKRTIGGMEVTIAINRFALGVTTTELSIYAKAIIPQGADGKRTVLFFGAENIQGSHTGGLKGDVKLSLLHDIEIPFNGGNTSIVLKGNGLNKNTGSSMSNTYMTIGCGGFKNLSLDAEVHFPTSLIIKAGGQNYSDTLEYNESSKSNQVVGRFSTVVESWDDLMVSINLPDFEIKGLKDYVFSLDNVVLDFSSSRNSTQIQFPKEYDQGYLPTERTMWRGVYADNISIKLPKAFSNVSISSKGLLIDDNGVTGIFSADSVLSIDKGNADGWKFSVDHFGLKIIANEIISSEFTGLLGLPFKGEKTTLGYEGFLLPNNEYLMRVNNTDTIDFSIFKAKASLDKNSKITMHLKDDRFVPEALLHGYMTLNKLEKNDTSQVQLQTIKFRSLKLTTKAPYISAEYFGYEGAAKLGNFPLSINKLSLTNAGNNATRLTIGAGINLGKDLFSSKVDLGLLAEYQTNHWNFKKFEIGSIDLKAIIAGVVGLQGCLNWYRNDAIFGNGFAGEINLGLSFKGKVESSSDNKFDVSINTRAGFGSKDNSRYWYADGMAEFNPGVPIFSVITLNGIGGALTSGVRAEGRSSNGGRFTNANYVPDGSMGLGFKASTVFKIKDIARCEAAFEMIFSKAGGLASAGFYGYAELPINKKTKIDIKEKLETQQSTFPDKLSEQLKQNDWPEFSKAIKDIPNAIKEMGISGTLGIQMDFNNNTLHANTEVFVNSPGNFIKGVGDRGQAGWGILHIDPNEWYFHLGNPSNRLGLQLNVGNILAVKTGSYFMAGNRIPQMPKPPQVVADMIGQNLDKLSLGRNLDALSKGKGLAFGSELSVKTGDIQFLIMYANFNAGLGFDIMFKDYGEAQCKHRSGAIGMNGWYAQGQTYAYLQGELGVKIKLWLLRARVPVIKGGVATLLQAGLPNPAYFKGYLGVNLDVLGLIKGRANFKLSLGEECDVVVPGSSPVKEPMINDISPSEGETQVSVFTIPQATFNVAIGKEFEITNELGEDVYYRIKLKEFIIKTKEGKELSGRLIWGDDKKSVSFHTKEILPPNSELTADVSVVFEELKNGTWRQVYTSGKPAVEQKIHKFTTGEAPNNIPIENIVYAYPVIEQRYMLTKEYDKGYVQLKWGQKYLFEKNFKYSLNFISDKGDNVSTDFRYNDTNNRIEFLLPKLDKQTLYTLNLSYTALLDSNITSLDNRKEKTIQEEDISVTIGGKSAQSTITDKLDQSILNYNFATSYYSTFNDKIKGITINDNIAYYTGQTFSLGARIKSKEAFDKAEITGTDKTQNTPLLSLKASLEEDYFTEEIYPLVYAGYPFGSITLKNRKELPIGVPPYHSFILDNNFVSKLNANTINISNFHFPFIFNAPSLVIDDFVDLRSSITNNRHMVQSHIYERFVLGTIKVLKKGKYKITISYVLPDGTITSSNKFFYENELNLNK